MYMLVSNGDGELRFVALTSGYVAKTRIATIFGQRCGQRSEICVSGSIVVRVYIRQLIIPQIPIVGDFLHPLFPKRLSTKRGSTITKLVKAFEQSRELKLLST